MRPTVEQTMMAIAVALSERATCSKRAVGCVLLDMDGHILSAGYNGVPHGSPHCNAGHMCPGMCRATHAESNAIISCHAHTANIHTCIVTHSPCMSCFKQLVQTGCCEVIYVKPTEELLEVLEFSSTLQRPINVRKIGI